jgi:hypothetical protein
MSNRLVIPSLVVALSVSAAGASLRFALRDPVTVVTDTNDASGVRPREIGHTRDALDGIRAVGDRSAQTALDVNTLDEVPDSSWFENRIGIRPMSIAETATGPNHEGSAPGPWMVTSGKTDGITPGLQMKDSAGRLYFVKFDPPGYPDLGTGAEVISTKLRAAAITYLKTTLS